MCVSHNTDVQLKITHYYVCTMITLQQLHEARKDYHEVTCSWATSNCLVYPRTSTLLKQYLAMTLTCCLGIASHYGNNGFLCHTHTNPFLSDWLDYGCTCVHVPRPHPGVRITTNLAGVPHHKHTATKHLPTACTITRPPPTARLLGSLKYNYTSFWSMYNLIFWHLRAKP